MEHLTKGFVFNPSKMKYWCVYHQTWYRLEETLKLTIATQRFIRVCPKCLESEKPVRAKKLEAKAGVLVRCTADNELATFSCAMCRSDWCETHRFAKGENVCSYCATGGRDW